MTAIDLVVTVCAVLSPTTCEETHLVFSSDVSLRQCVMAAQPYIAQWIGEHPKWTAVKWRCNIHVTTKRPPETQCRLPAEHWSGRSGYLLQSFKSLSATENTASALISMSRTMQCFEPR